MAHGNRGRKSSDAWCERRGRKPPGYSPARPITGFWPTIMEGARPAVTGGDSVPRRRESEPDRRLHGQTARPAHVSHVGSLALSRVLIRDQTVSGGSDAWCGSQRRNPCESSSDALIDPSRCPIATVPACQLTYRGNRDRP